MPVDPERISQRNAAPPRPDAAYVLYWAQMNRRVPSNHALVHAAELAADANLPLLVYEGLTCTYKCANDRLHTFLLEAVPGFEAAVRAIGAGYFFHLRRTPQDANDVLYRLAAKARCVVTDDYPTFIAATHNRSVPPKLDIPYIVVDSSCVVPMSRQDKRNYGAYTIRPRIHRDLPRFFTPCPHLPPFPQWDNKRDVARIPPGLPPHTHVTPDNIPTLVASCAINHSIPPSLSFTGGYAAARKHLDLFIDEKLNRYAKDRNEPSRHATSDLSPWLHFGHISSLEVALAARDYAKSHNFLADEFLEELIVRRELAFNFARFTEFPETLDVLPDWCKKTLATHANDERDAVYSFAQFEKAETHDRLWNACQKELLLRGKIHGYYRMYWGKKIIEWSRTHADALETMIRLHDIYALDGRDPNTYTNILWCFGLHDRPWGERPVFGQLRYMSGDGMKRKTDTDAYIREIAFLERTGKDSFKISL